MKWRTRIRMVCKTIFTSVNQSKTVTLRRRWVTSAMVAAHRRRASAARGNDDIDWPLHSLMFSFQDLRGPLLRRLSSTKLCSMIFGSVSWRQTWPNMITCDAWRLTAEDSEVRLGYWRAAKRIRSFFAICLVCQASFCGICFQRSGFAFPDQPSTSSFHTHREETDMVPAK